MADRSVKVTLVLAAQGYMSGMDAVAQKTAQTGTEIEKLAQKKQAFSQLGAAAMGFGAVAAAGVGVAISRFADFDQQMSFVQAATHETASNMNLLRDAALDAGARTVFSATEAAGAIEELAKAGVSTRDILAGGLDAALDLAAAGGLGVADAAGIAATALETFNLRGEDMSHVADLLAAGAGKAMGDVSELSQALAQGGLVAKATGLSIEETTAGLSAFAAEGLRGSDAGTSFKSMLQRLTPQSKEAKDAMDELGISAFDANGEFIGLSEFAGVLQNALRDLTPEQRNAAMATIFGADAVRAANILYEQGASGIEEWTDKVNDQGYAAETAALRLDNLKGDLEALGGAFDTALIQSGSGANDALRAIVQTASGAVTAFSELPEPVQQAALYLGLAAAAVGLVGGAALVAVPKVAEFKTSMDTLGLTGANARAGLSRVTSFLGGPWGIAMLAASAATLAFNKNIEAGVPSQSKIANAAQKSASAMDMLRAATERGSLESNLFGSYADQLDDLPGLLDRATEAGWRWAELSFNEQGALDSIDRLGDVLGEMAGSNLPAAQDAFRKLTTEFSLNDEQASQLLNEMPALRDALLEQATAAGVVADDHMLLQMAMGESTESTETAAKSYLNSASAVSDLQGELTSLIETINAANGVGQDAISSNISYQDALAEVDDTIRRAREGQEGYSLSLDQNTQVGRDNLGMLNDLAGKSQAAAQAQFELDGNTNTFRSTLEAGRQAVIDRAQQLGYNADEASRLADQIYRIPSEREINIIAETQQAQDRVNGFINTYDGKRVRVYVDAAGGETYQIPGTTVRFNATGNYYAGGKVKEFAAGGWASGIYPATKGGIHRFAEAGHDEAYLTMDPQHISKTRRIWSEVGDKLGLWESQPIAARAWSPAPVSTVATVATASDRPLVEVNNNGPSYSYDPTDIARAQTEQITRALDAYGIR